MHVSKLLLHMKIYVCVGVFVFMWMNTLGKHIYRNIYPYKMYVWEEYYRFFLIPITKI